MRLIRIWAGIAALSLQRELAHRANMVFQGLLTCVGIVASLTTLTVVFANTRSLAGWGPADAVVLLGTYQIVQAFLETFIEPNLEWFSDRISRGLLDDILLKPTPSILMASLGSMAPWSAVRMLLGILVVLGGALKLPAAVPPARIIGYVGLLVVAIALIWATRVLAACVSFWAPGLDPTALYNAVLQLGRYPVTVYGPSLQRVLTTILPVAFVSTCPALALTKGIAPTALALGLALVAAMIGLASLVWHLGLRRYASATS